MVKIKNDCSSNSYQVMKYYRKSIFRLRRYIKSINNIPSKAKWDKYAVKHKLLSSLTIGYLSGYGFNRLCRAMIKAIHKNNYK